METLPNDEINLQELAVRIIRYFKSHILFILISSALGIALGVGIYRALPSIYESKMILLSDVLTRSYGERIDESLNSLIAEGNHSALSVKLNLTPEEASTLTSINIECIVEVNPQREATKKDETLFFVTVDLKDRSILPRLQDGLIAFFRNNEYVKIRTRQSEMMYSGLIKKIDKELLYVDSLKSRLIRGSSKGETLILDPSALFSSNVHLSESQWEYKNALELSSSIHLLEGFTVFEKPKDPKLLTLSVLGFLLGFLGSIGLLTLKELFQMAR